MFKLTTDDTEGQTLEITQTLDELAREGAWRMIAAALEVEVAEYVEELRHHRDENGHALVVRNGRSHHEDGNLGFWAALRDVLPETREQRCWKHKTANVLDKLPMRLQARTARPKCYNPSPDRRSCSYPLLGYSSPMACRSTAFDNISRRSGPCQCPESLESRLCPAIPGSKPLSRTLIWSSVNRLCSCVIVFLLIPGSMRKNCTTTCSLSSFRWFTVHLKTTSV